MGEYTVADSLKAWEANAAFWDAQMGEDANAFHKEVIRPKVSELLEIQPHDLVLDIACGNGQFAAYLASKGAEVVAFDYSPNMIALARKRQKNNQGQISFHVIDATDRQALCTLKRPRAYDKAVCNMAVMDMPEIATLFQGVHALLAENGCFVFSTQHPCFVTLTDRYMTPHSYTGEAIAGQPVLQCYYHRPLQQILQTCFQSGFVIDGFFETCYGAKEKPDVIIVRARKCAQRSRVAD